MEMRKFSLRRPRSVDGTELGHFTLLFCRGRGLRFIVLFREDLKISPFANVITKTALSPQLFKDPECWSGRDLNLRPPAQQSGDLPTELTGRGQLLGTLRS